MSEFSTSERRKNEGMKGVREVMSSRLGHVVFVWVCGTDDDRL